MVRVWGLGFFLISVAALPACSQLSSWWGEPRPISAVVEQKAEGNDCPDLIRIADGEDEQSRLTLECWADKLEKVWTQVKGKKPNQLSDEEIKRIVEARIFTISNSADSDYRRVMAAKKLLGIKGSVSRTVMQDWIQFARENRQQLRVFWVHLNDTRLKITHEDVMGFVAIAIPLMERLNWKMNAVELGQTLNQVLELKNPFLQTAMVPLIEVVFSAYTSICPTFTDPLVLATHEVGRCVSRMIHAFSPGKAWFEYVFNPPHFKDSDDEIIKAMDFLYNKIGEWFSHPNLRFLDFRLWVEFSKALQARPPENLFDTMTWIRNFNTRSNEFHLHPLAYRRFFEVAREFHTLALNGQKVYLKDLQANRCRFSEEVSFRIKKGEVPDWKDCILSDYPAARQESKALDLLMRAKNLDSRHMPVELTGGDFLKTSLIHAVSRQIVIAFGRDNEAIAVRGILGEDDEAMEMVASLVAFQEQVLEFFENIMLRLEGKNLNPPEVFETFSNFDLRGLAQLVALIGTDILVQRTDKEEAFLREMVREITRINPAGSQVMDQLALTGVLALVDSLESYRARYLKFVMKKNPPTEMRGRSLFIDRQALVDAVPDLLKNYYSRTYRHCNEFISFRRTCGLVYDEIIPRPSKGDTMIKVSNMDLITLIATGMESLVDTCDSNRDGWLQRDPLGTGEVACVQMRAVGIAKRLMDADIIVQRWEKFLDFMHNTVNFLSLTRLIPRYVLASPFTRGDLRVWATIVDLLPQSWYQKGSLGSLYSLLGWLVDKDRAKILDLEHRNYVKVLKSSPPVTMPRNRLFLDGPTAVEILNYKEASTYLGPLGMSSAEHAALLAQGMGAREAELLSLAKERFHKCWERAQSPEEKQDCRSGFLRDLGLPEQDRPGN